MPHREKLTPEQALEILKNSHLIYQENGPTLTKLTEEDRSNLSAGQNPIAIIVSCSDSRVPPELIFNQLHGNLFVIRIAGNSFNEVTLGNIEFALSAFNISLILIMGHSKCGAVQAALETPNAQATEIITKEIKPAFENSKFENIIGHKLTPEIHKEAVITNINYTISQIQNNQTLAKYIAKSNTKISGAYYEIESGIVIFL